MATHSTFMDIEAYGQSQTGRGAQTRFGRQKTGFLFLASSPLRPLTIHFSLWPEESRKKPFSFRKLKPEEETEMKMRFGQGVTWPKQFEFYI